MLCHQRVSAACRAPTCRIPYPGVPCGVTGFPGTVLLCHSPVGCVRTWSAAARVLAQDPAPPAALAHDIFCQGRWTIRWIGPPWRPPGRAIARPGRICTSSATATVSAASPPCLIHFALYPHALSPEGVSRVPGTHMPYPLSWGTLRCVRFSRYYSALSFVVGIRTHAECGHPNVSAGLPLAHFCLGSDFFRQCGWTILWIGLLWRPPGWAFAWPCGSSCQYPVTMSAMHACSLLYRSLLRFSALDTCAVLLVGAPPCVLL